MLAKKKMIQFIRFIKESKMFYLRKLIHSGDLSCSDSIQARRTKLTNFSEPITPRTVHGGDVDELLQLKKITLNFNFPNFLTEFDRSSVRMSQKSDPITSFQYINIISSKICYKFYTIHKKSANNFCIFATTDEINKRQSLNDEQSSTRKTEPKNDGIWMSELSHNHRRSLTFHDSSSCTTADNCKNIHIFQHPK